MSCSGPVQGTTPVLPVGTEDHESPVSIVSLRAEAYSRHLPNAMKACFTLVSRTYEKTAANLYFIPGIYVSA